VGRVISVGNEAFQGGTFTPIPTGTKLRMSVFDIQETVGKTSGKPQFVFTAKVTEEGEYKGREIRYNYITLDGTAKNAWALVAFAEAVGWPTDPKKGVEVPDSLNDVLGTEFIGKVGISTDQNDPEKKYNRVTGYTKVGGAAAKKATQPTEAVNWGEV
jgi:hypothetical protein